MKALFRYLWISWLFFLGTGYCFGQSDTAYIHIYGSNGIEKGKDLIATPDSGFILLGSTGAYPGGGNSAYIIKTDSLGEPLWHRTIGSISVDMPMACSSTPEGGFIFGGFTDRNNENGYDGWLVKCASNGNVEWQETYGGQEWNRILDICPTNDSGYVLVGETYVNGNADAWILRTDSNGDTLWTRTWGGDGKDLARSVTKSTDSSFTVTGETYGSETTNIFLYEIHDNGDSLWSKTYEDTANERAYDVIVTQDGGRALFGETASYSDGDLDQFFLKTDDTGTVQGFDLHGGTAYFGHSSTEDDGGRSLVQIGPNEILTVGWTKSYGEGKKDMDFRRLNASGSYKYSANFFGTEDEVLNSIVHTTYQAVASIGWTESQGNGRDDMVLLLMDTLNSDPYDKTITHSVDPVNVIEREKKQEKAIKVFPNPFRKKLNIKSYEKGSLTYELYNMKGERLLQGNEASPIQLSTTALNPGSYLLRVYSVRNELSEQKLLIKE